MKERIPSAGAAGAMLVLTLVFAAAILLVPAVCSDGPANRDAVVPEYNTAEYEAWAARFEEKYGRPYDKNDVLAAARNGGLITASYIACCFGFFVLQYGIWDVGSWFLDRKKASAGLPDPKRQAARTAYYAFFAVLMLSAPFWLARMLQPVT